MELKPPAAGASIYETRQRVAGYAKLAESVLRVLTDYEKDRIRQEFFARYRSLDAVNRDPEFQIRMREVDREVARRREDLQAILKLIQDHDQVLTQFAAQEKEILAKDKVLTDREFALKNGEAELERKLAQVNETAEKQAAEIIASAEKQSTDLIAAAEKQHREALAEAEKNAAAMRADAEALIKKSESEAKERLDAAAQVSREAEALRAQLKDELSRVDEVLVKLKAALAERLKGAIGNAQAGLDQARKDIEELLK